MLTDLLRKKKVSLSQKKKKNNSFHKSSQRKNTLDTMQSNPFISGTLRPRLRRWNFPSSQKDATHLEQSWAVLQLSSESYRNQRIKKSCFFLESI